MTTAKRQMGNYKLSYWRKEKQYTQGEIADLIGISRKTYSSYERGKAMPPAQAFLALEQILEIPVRMLYESFEGCDGYVPLEDYAEIKRMKREAVLECL